MSKIDDIIRAALIEARSAGMTRADAAEHFGMSYQGFVNRIGRMGIEWPRAPYGEASPKSDRNHAILARHEAGELHTDIAKDYGVTRECIRQIVKKAGGEARWTQRNKEWQAIADLIASQPAMTIAEATHQLGFTVDQVRKGAKIAGVKFEKRDAGTRAELAAMAELVKGGMSFNQAAGEDHAKAGLLARFCAENGIETLAPSRWSVDVERRKRIIERMRLAGASWDEIALAVSGAENTRPVKGVSICVWASTHMDLASIKAPPKPRPIKVKTPRVKTQRRPAPIYAGPTEVVVLDNPRDTAIANYGKAPASAIAKAVGVSRNSIIGHWFRARQSGEIAT